MWLILAYLYPVTNFSSVLLDFTIQWPSVRNIAQHFIFSYLQYNTKICNVHNVCQFAELEVRTVTGGTWQG